MVSLSSIAIQDCIFVNNGAQDIVVIDGQCEVIGSFFSQELQETKGIVIKSGNRFGVQTATYGNIAINTFLCPAPMGKVSGSGEFTPSERWNRIVPVVLSIPVETDQKGDTGVVVSGSNGAMITGICFAVVGIAIMAVFLWKRKMKKTNYESDVGPWEQIGSNHSVLNRAFEMSTRPREQPLVDDETGLNALLFDEDHIDEMI
jgi:hypothetical protein